MRQTDTLFASHVIVGWLPRRLCEDDKWTLLDFSVHPRAVEHEIELGAKDAALVIDKFHTRRADLADILKGAGCQYARGRHDLLDCILYIVAKSVQANVTLGQSIFDHEVVVHSVFRLQHCIGSKDT